MISYVFFTCGIALVCPFVCIYTRGITDANYNRPIFGTLLLMAEMIYCVRDPYINAAYSTGQFKKTAKYAYTEATVNILISIALIKRMGLIGVSIGTTVAMLIRMIQHVIYLKHNILSRNPNRFYRKIVIYSITMILALLISQFIIPQYPESIAQWFIYGMIFFVITSLLFIATNVMFYNKQISFCIKQIKG